MIRWWTPWVRNPYPPHEDLRGTMGFQGFVMSDWLAMHSTDWGCWEMLGDAGRCWGISGMGQKKAPNCRALGYVLGILSKILTQIFGMVGYDRICQKTWPENMWACQDALAAGLDQEQPGIIQVLALRSQGNQGPALWHSFSVPSCRWETKWVCWSTRKSTKWCCTQFSHATGTTRNHWPRAEDRKVRQNAARHVLTAVYRLGLDHEPGCAPPNCTQERHGFDFCYDFYVNSQVFMICCTWPTLITSCAAFQELLSDQTKATTQGQRHEDIAFHAAACAAEMGWVHFFFGHTNGSHWMFSGFIMG